MAVFDFAGFGACFSVQPPHSSPMIWRNCAAVSRGRSSGNK
jgi:hypothetical protein